MILHHHYLVMGTVKNWWNVPNSYPKPDLYINAHIKLGDNPLRFTQVTVMKQKYGCVADR